MAKFSVANSIFKNPRRTQTTLCQKWSRPQQWKNFLPLTQFLKILGDLRPQCVKSSVDHNNGKIFCRQLYF